LTVHSANAVCTKSVACASINPLESNTASKNTQAITTTITETPLTQADNNKGNTHAIAGVVGENCAITPKAGEKCAP